MATKNYVIIWFSVVGLSLGLAGVASAEQASIWFSRDGLLTGVLRELPASVPPLEGALQALVAGPTDEEAAAGLTSAIPAGTTVVQITSDGVTLRIEFSEAMLSGLDEARLEEIYQQVLWTVRPFHDVSDLELTVNGNVLSDYLPPPPVIKPAPKIIEPVLTTGALSGHSITLSPGHGLFWTGSGWSTQRPIYCYPLSQEDYHNLEMMIYLEEYLESDGMTIKLVRCTDKNFGNHSSGNPWWKMGAYLWLQQLGYPCSVYGSATGCTTGSGGDERSDDIVSRPLSSNYDETDIYVSLHTNGFQGDCAGGCPTGSETYYDNSSSHAAWGAASQTLATNINSSLMTAIQTYYDATWSCHGSCVKDSNGAYGEIRVPDRPATLTELGFHDTCDRDGLYMLDNFYRSVAMWGMYKGICNYFGTSPTWAFYSYEYVSDTIPDVMNAGQSYNVSISFRNRGVLWNSARSFRLGAVGDSDPFTAFTRVDLPEEIEPGELCTFNFTMTAPATATTYTTDWRMVRDGFTWFGPTVSKQVLVTNPPATLFADDFESYADQAALEAVWTDSGATESYLNTGFGNGGKSVAMPSPSANSLGVYYVNLGQTVNGADNAPLVFQYDLYLDASGSPSWSGARQYCELRGYSGGSYGNGSLLNLLAIGLYNSSGDTFNTQRYQGRVLNGAGWQTLDEGGAPARATGWHKMRIEITTSQIKFYVDGILSETEARPNTDGFDSIVLGSNLTANGHGVHVDNVEVLQFVNAPEITGQPGNQNVCPDATATFTVTATGVGPLEYQWQKNNVDLTEGGDVTGTQTDSLQIAHVEAGDAGNFRCIVSNAGGDTASSAATLSVKAVTTVTLQPVSQQVIFGSNVSFTVTGTGAGTVSYQWKKDGGEMSDGNGVTGATASTLQLATVDTGDEGQYVCVVTADCGSVPSLPGILSLRPPPADFDGDRDVDLEDYGLFQKCLTGVAVPPQEPACIPADLDGDDDIDATDWDLFEGCFSGPNVQASFTCAPYQ